MTDSLLAGRSALVTGSSRGIGAAIARRLAAAGARVGVHCFRNVDSGHAVVEEICRAGGDAVLLRGDLTRDEDCHQVAAAATRHLGGFNILVNNAGSIQRAPFGNISVDLYREQFDTNVLSVLLMTQAAVRTFPASGGRVINLSSNIAFTAAAGVSTYSAAKAAVSMMTHCFAKELGARGITVNAVAPGATQTDMLEGASQSMLDGIVRGTPLGRIATPYDIADVVVFLASDAARWITGQTLIADGGYV